MPKVIIKFGKENYDIQIEPDDNFETLQAKVYAVSTVPPKNMRLLSKAGQIKDDNAVKNIKQGATLTLFGTKQSNIIEKIEQKKQQPKKIIQKEKQYFGLVNVGNTCYLNSGIQFLKAIPQLKNWFLKNRVANHGYGALVNSLGDVLKNLENNRFTPQSFVWQFLTNCQEFGPLGQQQDAEELVQKFLFLLEKVGKIQDLEGKSQNLVENLFQIEFQQKIENLQLQEEEPRYNFSTAYKLGCTIGGNNDIKIKSLVEGVRYYLKGQIERRSQVDNLNHNYLKTSTIKKLPKYLIVQMVRFFWKEASSYTRTKATSTKICKPIEYEGTLDLYQFCQSSLKEKLQKGRQIQEKQILLEQEQEKKRYEIYRQKNKNLYSEERELAQQYKVDSQNEKIKKFDEDLYRAHGLGLETGKYTLISVITHQGISVDSGHYMSWAHKSGNKWSKFNDDVVTQKTLEDVLNLKGGLTTSQISYILLYRKREVV